MITLSSTEKKAPVPFLLKVRDVAKLLNVSRHTIYAMIDCGDLKIAQVSPSKSKVGGKKKRRPQFRVHRDSMLALYKQRSGRDLNWPLEDPFDAATK